MNLGSEGVYLDEKCRTNPSRYLPGPTSNTLVKNLKIPILGFRGLGFWGLGGFGVLKNSRSTALSGLYVTSAYDFLLLPREVIFLHVSVGFYVRR